MSSVDMSRVDFDVNTVDFNVKALDMSTLDKFSKKNMFFYFFAFFHLFSLC